MNASAILATIMTVATFAALPWAISQLTIRWQPKLQLKRHRRNFRLITAALAAAATVGIPNGFPWLYLLAIGAAITLDVRWYHYAKTEGGARMLAAAKSARTRKVTA